MNRVSTTSAKPRTTAAQRTANIGTLVGNMTVPAREQIMAEALRHVGCSGEYEISRIVSKNLGVPERVVDAVILASYLEERSRRAAMEAGILGAVDSSRQAGRAVWSEIRGAA